MTEEVTKGKRQEESEQQQKHGVLGVKAEETFGGRGWRARWRDDTRGKRFGSVVQKNPAREV